MADEVGLEFDSLSNAGEALQQFIEPALEAEGKRKVEPNELALGVDIRLAILRPRGNRISELI